VTGGFVMALVAVSARTTCAVAVAQVLFYMATKVFLHQYSPMMKFLSVSVDCVLCSGVSILFTLRSCQVKSIIFLTFWQAMCVDFVPGMTPEEATRWNVGACDG
jgi:hypothetical protein